MAIRKRRNVKRKKRRNIRKRKNAGMILNHSQIIGLIAGAGLGYYYL